MLGSSLTIFFCHGNNFMLQFLWVVAADVFKYFVRHLGDIRNDNTSNDQAGLIGNTAVGKGICFG